MNHSFNRYEPLIDHVSWIHRSDPARRRGLTRIQSSTSDLVEEVAMTALQTLTSRSSYFRGYYQTKYGYYIPHNGYYHIYYHICRIIGYNLYSWLLPYIPAYTSKRIITIVWRESRLETRQNCGACFPLHFPLPGLLEGKSACLVALSIMVFIRLQ